MKIKSLFLLTLIGLASCLSNRESKSIPVLCLASYDTRKQGLDSISPEALKAYKEKGYKLIFDYYQKIKPGDLYKYPVVVGMIPQLHSGTKAINKNLANAIQKYVQDGGGFLLIPAPSYYGGEDFTKQLNPWLEKLGAKLLSEIPRDPGNQEIKTRVLDYRYLKTTNLKKHPVTEGINQVILPLDFSDSYLRTHTMTLSPEWKTLISGEETCRSVKFKTLEDGTYKSAPAFLAVRDIGRGRFAIFATASRYYIFDAYHWSFADGYAMKEGNGLKLMSNLFKYLSEGSNFLPKEKKTTLADEHENEIIHGNVPVIVRKKEWIDYVQNKFMPSGCSTKYYVDCGALSDIPYAKDRGYGYLDIPYTNWLIRWPWSEIFHCTASNSRGFDIKTLKYRFDNISKDKKYKLGIMLWGYQKEGSRSVLLHSSSALNKEFELPEFALKQGPLFKVLEIPPSSVENNSLTLEFSRGKKGRGNFSSICELWLWEKGQGPKQKAEEIISRFESPSAGVKERESESKYYEGIIGAKSNLSDGSSSVAEMANAAKEKGYSFIVFNDDAKKLDEKKLRQLKEECKKASDKNLICLPGISFKSGYDKSLSGEDNPRRFGDIKAYVFQNVQNLPPSDAYDNPHKLFWGFLGGGYCGGKKGVPTLRTPSLNTLSPFYQRFWRGFDVISYDNKMNVIDDSTNLFVDLLSSGYAPYPRTSGDFKSVEDVDGINKNTWKNVILAPNLKVLPLYHYSSFITNGPKILKYAFSFDHMREGECGGGILFRDDCRLIFQTEISSDEKINEVALYSGKRLVRRWQPHSKYFNVQEPLQVVGQNEFWMEVLAENGKKAVTGRFQTLDHSYFVGMCSDNQNSICSFTQKPTKFERDERELYLQHSYWHTGEAAGQLGILRDARKLVSRIIETGIIQLCKRFLPCPYVEFEDGRIEDHNNAKMRILSGSKDFNIIEYEFDTPQSRAKSKLRITSFRPAVGGGTTVLLESNFEKKKNDFKIKSLRNLSIATMPSLPPHWKYTYKNKNAKIMTSEFSKIKKGETVSDKLSQGSGIIIWPNDIGNLAIFPLDNNQYLASFSNLKYWNGRENLKLYSEAKEKNSLSCKLLVALHPKRIKSEMELDALQKYYTKLSSSVSAVNKGKLMNAFFPLIFDSQENTIEAEFNLKDRIDPLPVIVKDMNPNWACGKINAGKIDLLKVFENNAYTVISCNGKTQIGNLVKSSNDSLIMEWGGIWQDGVRLHLHNPLPNKIRPIIHANAQMDIPYFNGTINLKPGESIWVWCRNDLIIKETPYRQVAECEVKENEATICFEGGKQIKIKMKKRRNQNEKNK